MSSGDGSPAGPVGYRPVIARAPNLQQEFKQEAHAFGCPPRPAPERMERKKKTPRLRLGTSETCQGMTRSFEGPFCGKLLKHPLTKTPPYKLFSSDTLALSKLPCNRSRRMVQRMAMATRATMSRETQMSHTSMHDFWQAQISCLFVWSP